MKEKTADTEGHRNKVGLDQHKSLSSSTVKAYNSPNTDTATSARSKESSSKGTFLSPANQNNNANNNFDDDYNEWDISIGDLIIDLDADIERQSEGDKSTGDSQDKPEKAEPSNSTILSDLKQAPEICEPVMSSNFKSSRLNSLSTTNSQSNPSTSANNNSNILSTSPNSANSNGSSSGHVHRHHHGHNQRNNYTVTPSNVTPSNNSLTKMSNSMVEHHAKSLKMKIKRKNIGGKISEVNHEIVSSDTPPQTCKSYISSFDNSTSMSNNTSNNNSVASTIHVPNNADLSSSNSVITSSADSVVIPTASELPNSSKSSKHSSKNKSGHRDKKDKIRTDKERHVLVPPNVANSKPDDAAEIAPVLVSQTLLPDIYKYSTSSPTVIMKPEEANKTILNLNQKKADDKISETRDVGTSTSIATITEPDCLGPCEPGTSVTLEGIVWQETEGGVLVVNVTWRGKTYVGTLLDCTKHDWAPPRFCESPTSDIDSKSLKNTRGKRARGSFVSDTSIDTRSVTSKLRNGKGRRTANSGYVPPSPAKSDSSLSSNKRKGRPSELDLNSLEEASKKSKIFKPDTPDVQPSSPVLIECPEPNCSKKYKHINGLKYHQSHAHFGSTYNINDSQDCENAADSSIAMTKDTSDSEFNELSIMPESPSKNIPASGGGGGGDKFKSDANSVKSDCFDHLKSDCTNTQANPHHIDQKKLLNSANNELLVSDSITSQDTIDKFGDTSQSKTTSISNEAADGLSELPFDKLNHKKNLNESDTNQFEALSNNLSENSLEMTNLSTECIDLISTKPKLSEPVKAKIGSPSSLNANKTLNNEEEIENVVSPTFSDISDDTNTNDNANELVNFVSTQATEESVGEVKKPQSGGNFNLSSFPPYFNKSQYLVPNNSVEPKPAEACIKSNNDMAEMNAENSSDKSPHSSYPFSFYRFGPVPPPPPNDTKYPEIIPKPNNLPNSISSPTNVHNKSESDLFKEKVALESSKQPIMKESVDFNSNKQPIVELQNLKNRIPNYAFDQMPMFESPKQKFFMEREKDKNREKMKSQLKPTSKEKDNDKEKASSAKSDEGVKPTMETTGPPPPTNGYYYNPSFLPHSFPAMSHFDPMFRGNAMNHVVMNSPYGPPPASAAFLQSQLRFGSMGPLDSLSMANNVGRSSSHSPSTSSTKTSSHHLPSYNQNSKLSERAMHSPSGTHTVPSSSHSSIPLSYHKSPNKEFVAPINSNHSVPASSASDQRPPMTASSSLHPPRHPIHSYPIYDPYSAMIVNHATNSVQMHQFTPK